MKSKVKKIIVITALALFVLAVIAISVNFFYGEAPVLCYSDGSEIEGSVLDEDIRSELILNIPAVKKIFSANEKTTLNKAFQAKADSLTDENSAIIVLDKNGGIAALSGKAEYIKNPVNLGNVFSPVVFSAICRSNPGFSKENPVYTCTGSMTVKDRVLRCAGHGTVNFTDSEPHNDFFACRCSQMAFSNMNINNHSLCDFCNDTGILKELNIDGISVKGGEIVENAFNYIGESLNMSLIQICRFYSAICNDGKTPSVRILKTSEEPQYSELISSEIADTISQSFLNEHCTSDIKNNNQKAVMNSAYDVNSSIAVFAADNYTVICFDAEDESSQKISALNACSEMIYFCMSNDYL